MSEREMSQLAALKAESEQQKKLEELQQLAEDAQHYIVRLREMEMFLNRVTWFLSRDNGETGLPATPIRDHVASARWFGSQTSVSCHALKNCIDRFLNPGPPQEQFQPSVPAPGPSSNGSVDEGEWRSFDDFDFGRR